MLLYGKQAIGQILEFLKAQYQHILGLRITFIIIIHCKLLITAQLGQMMVQQFPIKTVKYSIMMEIGFVAVFITLVMDLVI